MLSPPDPKSFLDFRETGPRTVVSPKQLIVTNGKKIIKNCTGIAEVKGLHSIEVPALVATLKGPVVQKPINANPRLKINQENYFSTPKCCLTMIFGKTLH